MNILLDKHCIPCEGGLLPLIPEEVSSMLKEIPDWKTRRLDTEQIYRSFQFGNYYQVIAFVNAVAWIAHFENHHPYLEISYNNCIVQYWTHAINGLSKNDFICAKKVNNLFFEMVSTSNEF